MKLEDLYRQLATEIPAVIYISGKTCTGKSTFARRLQDNLGYDIVELDEVVREKVVKSLGLPDVHAVFNEVYRHENQREWVDTFMQATRGVIASKIGQKQPVVIDGAIANVNTLSSIFEGYPAFTFIYFHPLNLDTYIRNLTSRFVLATHDFSSGLPSRFWDLIDKDDFDKFVQDRKLTPSLEISIQQYARSSQAESVIRLKGFQGKFSDIIRVDI